MQIETIGQYRLELIAHELPVGGWDPFVSVYQFDAATADFKCLIDKQHVPGHYDSYEAAIAAATQRGNALIRERSV